MQEKIEGLTYASIDKDMVRKSWNRLDILWTAGILALVIGMYLYFSFWAR